MSRGTEKRAIIVGCNGQDGRILFEHLTARDYSILGIARDEVCTQAARGPERVDILDAAAVNTLVGEFQPDEVYYLAAFHHSSEDFTPLDDRQLLEASYQIHVTGLIHFLQALATRCPQGRLFYAASSHVFGNATAGMQDEQSPFNPDTAYGITKTTGIQVCRFYRQARAMHVSVGILFNHESPLRRPQFVSQKIVRAAVRVKAGLQAKIVLGDLSAVVDWGWARDYVDAMQRITSLSSGKDFIVASGQPHTVGQFVEESFKQLGLDWSRHVEENSSTIQSRTQNGIQRGQSVLIGNSEKLRKLTGWRPTLSFTEMISKLLEGAQEQLGQERA